MIGDIPMRRLESQSRDREIMKAILELKGPDGKTFDDWKAAAVFEEYGLKRWKE